RRATRAQSFSSTHESTCFTRSRGASPASRSASLKLRKCVSSFVRVTFPVTSSSAREGVRPSFAAVFWIALMICSLVMVGLYTSVLQNQNPATKDGDGFFTAENFLYWLSRATAPNAAIRFF